MAPKVEAALRFTLLTPLPGEADYIFGPGMGTNERCLAGSRTKSGDVAASHVRSVASYACTTTDTAVGTAGDKKDILATWAANGPTYAGTVISAAPLDLARKLAKLATLKGSG